MKKWNLQRQILTGLHMVAFLLIVVTGLKFAFKWDWNLVFTSVLLILVGAYLLIASQIKNFRTLKAQFGGSLKKSFFGFMNSVMFAFGVLFVFMGLSVLPFLGFLSIPMTQVVYGWILLVGGVLAILDVFNWI